MRSTPTFAWTGPVASVSEDAACQSVRDQETLTLVEDAINHNRAYLAFQPVQAAGKLGGPSYFEGLIRLGDAKGNAIAPARFIDLVEPHALGRRLDRMALNLGIQALCEHPTLRLAINLSPASFRDPGWREALRAGLASGPSIAERVILEFTERVPLQFDDQDRSAIRALQKAGVSFALDDFGSGQTSLRYLKDIYFDFLKIDGSFIHGISTDQDNQVLVSAIVAIARQFDMMTVAEKVETEEDSRLLEQIGVDFMQGYFWGMPSASPIWSLGSAGARPACA